jgi:hypothetical protein
MYRPDFEVTIGKLALMIYDLAMGKEEMRLVLKLPEKLLFSL